MNERRIFDELSADETRVGAGALEPSLMQDLLEMGFNKHDSFEDEFTLADRALRELIPGSNQHSNIGAAFILGWMVCRYSKSVS